MGRPSLEVWMFVLAAFVAAVMTVAVIDARARVRDAGTAKLVNRIEVSR